MLSYPDRNTFEQIRARWESGQPVKDASSVMVGRRERQPFQDPTNDELNTDSGSKFRRKLSHGLSFISNPLSQRRTTSGRQHTLFPSPAASQPAITEELMQTHKSVASLSPKPELYLLGHSGGSSSTTAPLADSHSDKDGETTPKPLPRSRTLSFIPRPIRAESESSIVSVEEPGSFEAPAATNNRPSRITPSRIPIASPVLSERLHPSPHQYSLYNTSKSAKHAITRIAPFGASNGANLKLTARSYTTPNLALAANLSREPNFMAPTRTANKKIDISSITQKQVLQENAPTSTRAVQRRSHIQDRSSSRPLLVISNSDSQEVPSRFNSPHVMSGQQNFNVASSGFKRGSSEFPKPMPITVLRKQAAEESKQLIPDLSCTIARTSSSSLRSFGSRYPSTPAPYARISRKNPLTSSKPKEDLRRKSLGAWNNSISAWRSSRSSGASNDEVRRLPKSNTFHNFGSCQEPAPPVPPVPEHYRMLSLSDLVQRGCLETNASTVLRPFHTVPDSKTYNSELEQSIEFEHGPSQETSLAWGESSKFQTSACFTANNSTAAPLKESPAFISFGPPQSGSTDELTNYGLCNSKNQKSSICPYGCLENADIDSFSQVTDFMPGLYWAGRFQARFDQWRTEATAAELKPDYKVTGPLGEFKLHQEQLAVCYIFAQLRELCTSNLAADSLWEFEFHYRRDHNIFGDPIEIVGTPVRKHDDLFIHKGAFGRAVRKLTPRKHSLVNLLKGKAWNKSEEKSSDNPEMFLETSSRCS